MTALDQIKEKKEAALKRIAAKGYGAKRRVYVGMATCEIAAGSKEVMEVFRKAQKSGLGDVYLSAKGCVGRCHLEPTIEVVEEGKIPSKYGKVTPEMAQEIVERHLKKGEPVQEWLIH
jgi:(2Fe-2S) ferredoxin